MNRDQLKGSWKQLRGKVREQWGKLTDDDMAVIDGKRDQLVGAIQRRYGTAKEEVEKQVEQWEERFREENQESRVNSTQRKPSSQENQSSASWEDDSPDR